MMTTLTVLATLVAVPFLFGVLLAVTLGGVMALHFAPDWVRAPRSGSTPRAVHQTRRYEGVPAARTVCSVRNTPDESAPSHVPVAQHILDCVAAWHTATRVLGSAGRARPPTPAPQLAKETS
jgi:hypothetical protein